MAGRARCHWLLYEFDEVGRLDQWNNATGEPGANTDIDVDSSLLPMSLQVTQQSLPQLKVLDPCQPILTDA